MKENDKKPAHVCTNAFGDCDRCTHSIVYHLPLTGCTKCECDEYR